MWTLLGITFINMNTHLQMHKNIRIKYSTNFVNDVCMHKCSNVNIVRSGCTHNYVHNMLLQRLPSLDSGRGKLETGWEKTMFTLDRKQRDSANNHWWHFLGCVVLWSLSLSSFSLPVSEIYECRVEKNLCALLLNFIVKFVDLSRNVCVFVWLVLRICFVVGSLFLRKYLLVLCVELHVWGCVCAETMNTTVRIIVL